MAITRLTRRKKRFSAEYKIDGNGTRAAIAAGYSPKGAGVRAAKLLKEPAVRAIVNSHTTREMKKIELTRQVVRKQLYSLLTRNARQLFDEKGILVINHQVKNGKVIGSTIHDLPDEVTDSIDGIKQKVKRIWNDEGEEIGEEVCTELKLAPKGQAVEMALKHKGMFPKEETVVKIGVNLAEVLPALRQELALAKPDIFLPGEEANVDIPQ
jgi:phage terminase small subunit